jgi:hypothetical protein
MSRRAETTIPIVLWVSAALVVHYGSFQGADVLADISYGKVGLRHFAESVRDGLRPSNEVFEVTFQNDPKEEKPEEKKDEPPPPLPKNQPRPDPPKEKKAEREKPKEPPKPKAPEKKLALPEPPKPAAPPPPPPPVDKRVAVVQHVEDKTQKDNPDAKFIADEANKVKEETKAEITARDQDDKKPTPGASPNRGPTGEVGNADKSKVADSEDKSGAAGRPPGERAINKDTDLPKLAGRVDAPVRPADAAKPANAPPADKAGQNGRTGPRAPAPPPPPQPLPTPTAPPPAAPDVVSAPRGEHTVSPFRKDEPKPSASALSPMAKAPPVPTSDRPFSLPKLGGGPGPSGVNFNLTPGGAIAAFGGHEKMRKERELDGERRKSAHRGTWSAPNFERYRAAMENYISSVKPGNQTALNTAAVPFASYLQRIHNRLHPVFAEAFLDSLDNLPQGHALNDQKLATSLELVLDGERGRIVKFGRTKTSGVTAFDVAALHAVNVAATASGFGKPPAAIVSPDGNVYLHWEFHRQREVACSTQNARPYMLNVPPAGGTHPEQPLPGPRVPSGDPREKGAPPAPPPPSREGGLPPAVPPKKRAG